MSSALSRHRRVFPAARPLPARHRTRSGTIPASTDGSASPRRCSCRTSAPRPARSSPADPQQTRTRSSSPASARSRKLGLEHHARLRRSGRDRHRLFVPAARVIRRSASARSTCRTRTSPSYVDPTNAASQFYKGSNTDYAFEPLGRHGQRQRLLFGYPDPRLQQRRQSRRRADATVSLYVGEFQQRRGRAAAADHDDWSRSRDAEFDAELDDDRPDLRRLSDLQTYAKDKAGKTNNYRGVTFYGGSLCSAKGSGGNGIDTVYTRSAIQAARCRPRPCVDRDDFGSCQASRPTPRNSRALTTRLSLVLRQYGHALRRRQGLGQSNRRSRARRLQKWSEHQRNVDARLYAAAGSIERQL